MRRVTIPADVQVRLIPLTRFSLEHLPYLTSTHCRLLARLCGGADWDPVHPARAASRFLDRLSGWPFIDLRRAAVATLALAFPVNAPDFELPSCIRSLYGPAFRRLAQNLTRDGVYDEEAFAKDLRFVLGLSAPAAAQDVDLAWRSDLIGVSGRAKRAVASLGRLAAASDIRGLKTLLDADPHRPWLQIHTDSRRLDDFNPVGWDRCYRHIASLLELHPDYAGMVGLSWFYDPAVARISPRLAYLQDRPMANGAVRIRMGGGPADVERATRTSETRRARYEAGLYSPRCWAVYWPRKALLRWARESDRRGALLRSAA